MNYQYYAKTTIKGHGEFLAPYSGVFLSKKSAREWKQRKHDSVHFIIPRGLILAEAIEKKEVEPVNTVFYEND